MNGIERELGIIATSLKGLEKGLERLEDQFGRRLQEHISDDDKVQEEHDRKLGAIERKLAYYTGALAALAFILKFFWK